MFRVNKDRCFLMIQNIRAIIAVAQVNSQSSSTCNNNIPLSSPNVGGKSAKQACYALIWESHRIRRLPSRALVGAHVIGTHSLL